MEKGNILFHKLDRFIGIPIVFLLGFFTKKRPRKDLRDIQRIAILNLASIGDSVLMSASVNDLKSQYPKAEFVVFTGGSNYLIFTLIPGFKKVVRLKLVHFFTSVKRIKNEGHFDVLVDYGPWPRINAIYSFFVKADIKIGFRSKNQHRHYTYNEIVDHSSEIHEIANYRNLIKKIYSGTEHDQMINIKPSVNSIKYQHQLQSYCIIHPWPGGYKSYMKEWPTQSWVDLVKSIKDKYNFVVITGSLGDVDKSKALYNAIIKETQAKNIVDLSGKLDLNEVIHIISGSKAIISVNTGIAHIAAALNINQVCLHGPTNPTRWKPISPLTISIVPQSGVYGYLNYGFEYDNAEGNCMENIAVHQVTDALDYLIKNDNVYTPLVAVKH